VTLSVLERRDVGIPVVLAELRLGDGRVFAALRKGRIGEPPNSPASDALSPCSSTATCGQIGVC
jgi:hypothetical protein